MPIPAGGGLVVSLSDFSTYLNNPNLDVDRATLILSLAQTLCESIVTPLPNGAEAVILDVAERAYANPTPIGAEGNAFYSEGVGPYSTSTPGSAGGGLYLTAENTATLRRLAGSGGAFMIDTLAASYKPSLPWWDAGGVVGSGSWDSPT